MKKNDTKIVCPKCGCEIAIPEHQHFTAGVCIGKDSGLGTVVLPAADTKSTTSINNNNQVTNMSKTNKTASEKIAALKAAGINVNNLFAMTGANGGDMVARLENGVLSPIADDDPIFKAIMDFGAIPERRLFRRWIASQIMHMLSKNQYHWYVNKNFTEKIQCRGYMYSWKVVAEEIHIQAKLSYRDPENFIKYNRGYNKEVVEAMANDYITKLSEVIANAEIRHCKGVEYKRFCGRDIFVHDLSSKVFKPLFRLHNNISKATDPRTLDKAVTDFVKFVKTFKLSWDAKMPDAFINAYKFTGAFFTMENFILFSNCFLRDDSGRLLNKQESLVFLYAKAEAYKNEGWRLFGVLKKFLNDNNIDPDRKLNEWSRIKELKRK